MYNKLRTQTILWWNEIVWKWLREVWPLRQWISIIWLTASYPLNGNATAEIWTNATATNMTRSSSQVWYFAQMGTFNWTNAFVLPPSNLVNNTNTFSVSVRCRRLWNANTWDGKIFDYRNSSGRNIYIANNNSPANMNFWVNFWTSFNHTISADFTNKRAHFVLSIEWWTCFIYRDWVLITSWSCWTTTRTSSNGRIWNEWNAWASRFFNWNIALVRCYNRWLTSKEIQALYLEWLSQLH